MSVWLQLGMFGCISYLFIDRNGWPISPDQETDLRVVDAVQDMCVKIALPSDMPTCLPAVIQKTSVKTVKLKRSVSVEQYAAKRPRFVLLTEFNVNI